MVFHLTISMDQLYSRQSKRVEYKMALVAHWIRDN